MLWYIWNCVSGESGMAGPFESMSKLENAVSDQIQDLGELSVNVFSIADEHIRPDIIDFDINEILESVTW